MSVESEVVQVRRAYPVELDKRADTVLVKFPDVPEALTEGATEEEALAESLDCLVAALGGYIQSGRAIPAPSPAGAESVSCESVSCESVSCESVSCETVELPEVVAAKIALYEAGRAEQLDEQELAERLGCSGEAARALLDLDSPTPLPRLLAALHTLGQREQAPA